MKYSTNHKPGRRNYQGIYTSAITKKGQINLEQEAQISTPQFKNVKPGEYFRDNTNSVQVERKSSKLPFSSPTAKVLSGKELEYSSDFERLSYAQSEPKLLPNNSESPFLYKGSFKGDEDVHSRNKNNYDEVKRTVTFSEEIDLTELSEDPKGNNNQTIKNKLKPNNVKSRLYEGNTAYQNRLEESKRIIEENKRKAMSSPKRFVSSGVQPSSPTSSKQSNNYIGSPVSATKIASMKQVRRLNQGKPPVKPKNTNDNIKTMQPKHIDHTPEAKTEKIKHVGKPRSNFKSPTAIRKAAPLNEIEEKERLQANASAARTSRRTREERKKIIEEQAQKSNEKQSNNENYQNEPVWRPKQVYDYTKDLMSQTIGHDIQEEFE